MDSKASLKRTFACSSLAFYEKLKENSSIGIAKL